MPRMSRTLPLSLPLAGLLALLPGIPAAQQRRSGPDAPAAGAQIQSTSLPGESPGQAPPARRHAQGARASAGRPAAHRSARGASCAPRAPIPGATQPNASEGFTTNRDRIPPRPADRPDGSTTGR